VEGEVKTPGLYPYTKGLTALDACLLAGGFSKYAAPNRTRIVRKKGDQQVIIKINLEKVKDGRIPDIELQPDDLVNVPETWF
jgi:polysaccharide export outer membrane protein